MVVIHKRDSRGPVQWLQSRVRCHVLELALPKIAEQQHSIVRCHGQIVEPIAVEVTHRARNRMSARLQPRTRRIHLFELAAARVVQHPDRLLSRSHENKVHRSRTQ